MNITIYEITKDGVGRYLALPVPPETITQSAGLNFADAELLGVGEVTRFGKRRQRRIPLSFLWPKHYNPTICVRRPHISPDAAEGRIRKWAETARPVKVAFSHAPLGGLYTIRELTIERERPGHPGDLWVTCELVEYVQIKLVKRTRPSQTTKSPKATTRKPIAKKTPTTYIVKNNESLSIIAKKVWGEGGKKYYDAIWYANRALLTQYQRSRGARNKYTIYAGMKLRIPKKP